MGKRIVIAAWLLLSAVALWPESGATQSEPPQSEASRRQAFLNEYCASCHDDKAPAGGMSLSQLNLERVEQSAEVAEKVIRKMRTNMMPPPGMPQPDKETAGAFISGLERSLDEAAAARPNPGRPALHRLNRTEYANSVRDLLGVNVEVSSLLPPDNMSQGFDNMSDVLTVSPALMDAYIRAAGKISRQAVGDREALPLTSTYSVPRVASQSRHVEGAPFGTRGGISVVHDFPADGEYVFRLSFHHHPNGPLFGINQGKGQQIEVSVDLERVALLDIDPYERPGAINKTPPIKIKAGPRRISAAFIKKFDGPIDDEFRQVEQTLVDLIFGGVPGTTTLPHLQALSVTGPTAVSGVSDTPSRRKIFTCRPTTPAAELPCARKIINGLATRAFRRPLTREDTDALVGLYRVGRRQGDFETGVRTAVQAILSHPEFVFRFEHTPEGLAPGQYHPLTDTELASRLSYFLWSSAPDDRLLNLASRGRLSEPAAFEREVRRMLADPRSQALVANFAGQWLLLQNLRDTTPDLLLYPDFDKTLAHAMRRETELLFESVMREDRSVLDLLAADYTHVDERLARHYSIPNVLGNRFRRVRVTDENRKGLLGHAGILMLTSAANRTSPVKRGKYVLEVLLGTPPPPPPPDIPALAETSGGPTGEVVAHKTVRERLEQHVKNPSCATCHRMIDPLGLALENFGPLGVWRTKDNGHTIDPTGQMYDGTKLDGPASLRRALLSRGDMFVETFTQKILSYGLGRVISYRDMPVVRSIKREAAANDNRFSSFVLGVVRSPAFRMRSVEAEEVEPAEAAVSAHAPRRQGGQR